MSKQITTSVPWDVQIPYLKDLYAKSNLYTNQPLGYSPWGQQYQTPNLAAIGGSFAGMGGATTPAATSGDYMTPSTGSTTGTTPYINPQTGLPYPQTSSNAVSAPSGQQLQTGNYMQRTPESYMQEAQHLVAPLSQAQQDVPFYLRGNINSMNQASDMACGMANSQ